MLAAALALSRCDGATLALAAALAVSAIWTTMRTGMSTQRPPPSVARTTMTTARAAAPSKSAAQSGADGAPAAPAYASAPVVAFTVHTAASCGSAGASEKTSAPHAPASPPLGPAALPSVASGPVQSGVTGVPAAAPLPIVAVAFAAPTGATFTSATVTLTSTVADVAASPGKSGASDARMVTANQRAGVTAGGTGAAASLLHASGCATERSPLAPSTANMVAAYAAAPPGAPPRNAAAAALISTPTTANV